jgi:hypothetical protein
MYFSLNFAISCQYTFPQIRSKHKAEMTRNQGCYSTSQHLSKVSIITSIWFSLWFLSSFTWDKSVIQHRPMYYVGCNPEGWKTYIRTEYYFLFHGLEVFGWQELPQQYYFHEDNERHKMWQELIGKYPSVILFCENHVERYARLPIQQLRLGGTHIAAFSDDLHMYNRYSSQRMYSILQNTDTLVGAYAYLMEGYFSSVMNTSELPNLLWIPHSASPPFTDRVFNSDPIEKILLSGAARKEPYPIRHWLLSTFAATFPLTITVLPHPGYQNHLLNQSNVYAEYLRAYEACITTTMSFRRIVAKVFEIPATGSLLLINLDLESLMASLGMINGKHYVGFENNDPSKAIWWTQDPSNKEKIKQIRKAGQKLALASHKTSHRVVALNDYFQTKKKMYPFETLHTSHPCPMVGFPIVECLEFFSVYVAHHNYTALKPYEYLPNTKEEEMEMEKEKKQNMEMSE